MSISPRLPLSLAGALALGCALSAGSHAEPPAHAEWELTFDDEFERDGVDWEVWASQSGPRGGDKPEGRWPENNVVRDGVLYQVTERETPARGGKEWSSAHIWTKSFSQQYGYFEARLRYGQYLNNAFWLWRPASVFPKQPHFEIDINEGHTPRQVAMTLHFYFHPEGDGNAELFSTSERWEAPVDLDEDFHLYGMEWDEEQLIWYVDGKPVRRLQNPICHAPVDLRLSTVIMTRQLEKDGVDIGTMDGVSMATDWVRAYRKVRDMHEPELPPLEPCEIPTPVKREPQVAIGGESRLLVEEDFEGTDVGALPEGWEVGDGEPGVAAGREGRDGKTLMLDPGEYAFRMFDKPVTGRLEVELDYHSPPGEDGLLLVTLGQFDSRDPERRKTSYYTGDIGPYIHWKRAFICYYTEEEKWTPFAAWRKGEWNAARFLLDVANGAFDYYGGADIPEFQSGGVFRHTQRAAKGIGLRHRGSSGTVHVDNIVVRMLED